MPSLPPNVLFSTITGRFLHAKIDGSDVDRAPDGDPWPNLTVKFQASIPSVKNKVSDPPTWITLDPVVANTDLNGDLVTPADGAKGVLLIATDNPDLGDGVNWYWNVQISGSGFPGISFNFRAPANSVIDLTKVAPLPADLNTDLAAWELVLKQVQTAIAALPKPSDYPSLSSAQLAAISEVMSGRLGAYAKSISNTDLNELRTTGFFSGSTLANKPGTASSFYVNNVALSPDGAYVWQIAAEAGRGGAQGILWQRFREGDGTGWTQWKQIADQNGAVDNTLRNILTPAERVGPRGISVDNLDANNVINAGFYSGKNLTNAPTGSTGFFFILVQPYGTDTNWLQQTATEFADNAGNASSGRRTWVRQRQGGAWTGWTLLADNNSAIDTSSRSSASDLQSRWGQLALGISTTDLNARTVAGIYTGWNLTNAPSNGYFYVEVQAHNGANGWVQQRVTELASSGAVASTSRKSWVRQQQNGVWTAWALDRDNGGAIDQTARNNAAAAVPISSATTGQVYSNSGGTPSGVSFGTSAVGGTLAQRDAAGQVNVASTPTTTNHATSKQYVDGALATKADLVNGVIPTSQTPAIAITTRTSVANQAARLAQTSAQVQPGDITTQSDTGGVYLLADTDPSVNTNWILINSPTGGVSSVNNQTGAVTLGKADIGLGNVDNTSDANKPVSTAQQTALNAKLDISTVASSQLYAKGSGGTAGGVAYGTAVAANTVPVRDANSDLLVPATPTSATGAASKQYADTKAPLASPALTGTPTAPTAVANTRTTQVATTAFAMETGDQTAAAAATGTTGTIGLQSTGSGTQRYTVAGATTFTLAAGTSGRSYSLTVVLAQDATGGRAITLPTNVKWDSGTKPTLSTAANAIDVITLFWSGTEWIGFLAAKAIA